MRGRQVIIIWSTDWIKDAKTEGEKLLSAVRKAISKYKADGVQTVSVSSNQKERENLISSEAASTEVEELKQEEVEKLKK